MFSGQGSTDDIVAPFLTQEERDAMRERREEEMELMAARQQVAKLMRMCGDTDG